MKIILGSFLIAIFPFILAGVIIVGSEFISIHPEYQFASRILMFVCIFFVFWYIVYNAEKKGGR